MKHNEFKSIYDQLNDPRDIQFLSKELGLDEELLNVIFTQKTVREATKKFHIVKKNARRLANEWKNGRSLLSIARKWRFPPMLTGLLLFQEMGYSKKQFWKFVREPECTKNPRIKREIEEITREDMVYSPWASEVQCQRGHWGEKKLQDWLDSKSITYRTEKDLRGEYPKTPDCLLDKPMKINGWKVNWIESKASFGDKIEVRKNVRNQLSPYVELFGHGIVVYWFGHVEEIDVPPGIEVVDASLLEMECSKG
jgi:hypothetical protein